MAASTSSSAADSSTSTETVNFQSAVAQKYLAKSYHEQVSKAVASNEQWTRIQSAPGFWKQFLAQHWIHVYKGDKWPNPAPCAKDIARDLHLLDQVIQSIAAKTGALQRVFGRSRETLADELRIRRPGLATALLSRKHLIDVINMLWEGKIGKGEDPIFASFVDVLSLMRGELAGITDQTLAYTRYRLGQEKKGPYLPSLVRSLLVHLAILGDRVSALGQTEKSCARQVFDAIEATLPSPVTSMTRSYLSSLRSLREIAIHSPSIPTEQRVTLMERLLHASCPTQDYIKSGCSSDFAELFRLCQTLPNPQRLTYLQASIGNVKLFLNVTMRGSLRYDLEGKVQPRIIKALATAACDSRTPAQMVLEISHILILWELQGGHASSAHAELSLIEEERGLRYTLEGKREIRIGKEWFSCDKRGNRR